MCGKITASLEPTTSPLHKDDAANDDDEWDKPMAMASASLASMGSFASFNSGGAVPHGGRSDAWCAVPLLSTPVPPPSYPFNPRRPSFMVSYIPPSPFFSALM